MAKTKEQKSFVINNLRRVSYKWQPRNEALAKARAAQLVKRGRLVWHYNCVLCPVEQLYSRKEVEIDHVVPVVDVDKGFTTWDDYIDRMYCDVDGYQILCLKHHDEKTALENQGRVRKRRKTNVAKKRKKG